MQEKNMRRSNDLAAMPTRKLMVSGLVRLERETNPVEIQRGMSLMSQDGVETGVVAAVVLDCSRQEVTHILLSFVPPTAVYHLILLPLINRIDEETVWLRITSADIDNLPRHQPGC